jgi:hypothetical protein
VLARSFLVFLAVVFLPQNAFLLDPVAKIALIPCCLAFPMELSADVVAV